jgi:hypothetical protein
VLSGGVRRSATICVFSQDDEEMLKAKTGNWYYENPQRARSNNSVLLLRNETTQEHFDEIIKSIKEFGEPGFVLADSTEILLNPCCEIGMWPVDETTGLSGWQMCVSGDTRLITLDGITTIENSVGKEIHVWNGEKWSKTKPFLTGKNKTLYRVHFGDGSYLDCTDNHKFLVKDRFMRFYHEVETKDLMTFSKYAIHTPRPNVEYPDDHGTKEEYSYEYGFILGDGTARHNHSPFASLFKNDSKLNLTATIGDVKYNENGTEYYHATFDKLNKDFSVRLKYNNGLPIEIFSWNKSSIIDFISGWVDADGSQANKGWRIAARSPLTSL